MKGRKRRSREHVLYWKYRGFICKDPNYSNVLQGLDRVKQNFTTSPQPLSGKEGNRIGSCA